MRRRLQTYFHRRRVIRVVGSFDEAGLYKAIKLNQLFALEALLQGGVSPQAITREGSPVLCEAIKQQRFPMLQKLLEMGANPNQTDLRGQSPLMHAIESGQSAMLEFLLRQQVSLEQVDDREETALIKAVRKGHFAMVQALLQAGADPDAANWEGITPLMIAVDQMRSSMVKLLLEAGADPGLEDRHGRRVMDHKHLSPRIKRLLQQAAAEHRVESPRLQMIPDQWSQKVSELSSLLAHVITLALRSLDKTGAWEQVEYKGREILARWAQDIVVDAPLNGTRQQQLNQALLEARRLKATNCEKILLSLGATLTDNPQANDASPSA